MTFIFFLIAVASSIIWIDFFRLIKADEDRKPGYFVLMFSLGAISYMMYDKLSHLFFSDLLLNANNKTMNHFIVTVLSSGFIGEFFKIGPILLVYRIYKKEITEPIHLFSLFSIFILGYAAIENMYYSIGSEFVVFSDRTMLTTLGEIFITSIFAYGLIAHLFYHRAKKPMRLILYFTVACFVNGFYNFWLDNHHDYKYGFIFTLVCFLILMSIFSVTLTNAFNFSSDFSYKTIIKAKGISKRLLRYHIALLVIQYLFLLGAKGFVQGTYEFIDVLLFSGLLILTSVNKLPRIKKIKRRWNKLKIELPFTFYKIDLFNGRSRKYKFKFKGETFKEYAIDQYFKENCNLYPLSTRNTFIVSSRSVFVEKKVFLKNDETFYLVKVLNDDKNEYFLLKPKNSGKMLVKRKYAIVGLFSIINLDDLNDKNLTAADFQFREWVFVKHR